MLEENKKKWDISSEISKNDKEKFPKYSKLLLQLLYNRGFQEEEEIDTYLDIGNSKSFHDPFLFKDMRLAVDLIIKHIKKASLITVYGDYDADGVSSCALLLDALRILRAKTNYYLPDRITEGYGLNRGAIDEIAAGGTRLIITVDNGIRNKDEVEYIKKNKMDVIISDHHSGTREEEDSPDCLILNPSIARESYPDKFLSGAGVAFKLASALIEVSTIVDSDKKKLKTRLLDLAAIGTVADCVKLKGENRSIVKKGLKALDSSNRQGIVALIKAAGLEEKKPLDTWNISFQLAPRINAAGRMDHANTAFKLLVSKNIEEAEALAARLNENNQKRQKLTKSIVDSVEKKLAGKTKDYLLYAVYSEGEFHNEEPWSEGIVGLVASRITDKYFRPCLIITKTADGYKGSGRSIPGFDIVAAMEKCSKYLDKYGGHPMACGFSTSQDKLKKFLNCLSGYAKLALSKTDIRPKISIDMLLEATDISEESLSEINRLRPFGQGNEQPKFVSKNLKILERREMGKNNEHLKLFVKSKKSRLISALAFGQAKKWEEIQPGDKVDIVYSLDLNEYNGRREVQLKIIDIRLTQEEGNN